MLRPGRDPYDLATRVEEVRRTPTAGARVPRPVHDRMLAAIRSATWHGSTSTSSVTSSSTARSKTRDVITLPGRLVTNWWRRDGHSLVLADLDEVIDELPEHLVVGSGAYGGCTPIRPRSKTCGGGG